MKHIVHFFQIYLFLFTYCRTANMISSQWKSGLLFSKDPWITSRAGIHIEFQYDCVTTEYEKVLSSLCVSVLTQQKL